MPLTTFPPAYPINATSSEAITALAGGGQAGATQLVSRYNRVTVVATAADSVLLPNYLADLSIFVSNDAANALAVFPQLGQQISSAAVNAVFSVPAGKTAQFIGSGTPGKWAVILSA